MASAGHGSLLLLLLIAGICDAADYNIVKPDFVRGKFESWMAKHGRVYNDEAEKARRFEIFRDNLKFIEEFNKQGNHSYKVGLTRFTDITNEEFRAMYSSEPDIPKSKFDEKPHYRSLKYEDMQTSNDSLLSGVDWRALGAVGPVINQGQCESCWAMAATAAVEGLNHIQTGKFVSLSAQQLIDCDPYNNGCHRGFMTKAYRYIYENGGLTDARTYPFTYGVEQMCDRYKEKKVAVRIGGYREVPLYNEAALMAAVANQPVSVAVDVLRYPSFQHYTGGIYDGPCGTNPDHAVVVVGYGQSGYDNYWIVKNSWGVDWGDRGYVYMRKDLRTGSPYSVGICGITLDASYPTA